VGSQTGLNGSHDDIELGLSIKTSNTRQASGIHGLSGEIEKLKPFAKA
jgi:hypothetical protein